MLEYEESIVIGRPVKEVFSYMQDIEREHEWQPNLREAEQDPPGEPQVGTKRRYVSEFMGVRFENRYTYTVYERNSRVAYRTAPDSDTEAEGEVIWESVEGGTRVTMRAGADFGGMLGFVPRRLMAKVARKELADTLARLKARLEAG